MDDKELKSMVKEMHTALIGDEYGNTGICKKVNRHEKRIKRLEGFAYVVGGVGTFIVFLLKFGEGIKNIIQR